MIDPAYILESSEVQKFYYNLNDRKPIEVITNRHKAEDESWFDMHYEIELGIVLTGQMKRCFLDRELTLGKGEIWLHGMWEPHGFEIVEAPCEVMVFEVFPELLLQENGAWLSLFMSGPDERPQIPGSVRPEILRIADKIQHAKTDSKENYHHWVRVLFFELMLHLSDHKKDHLRTEPSGTHYFSIQPAVQLVFTTRRHISVDEAAHACGLSKNSFSRDFKRLMRIPFPKFALQYRLRGAVNQMKKTHDTLEKVAADWGFTDASHLFKLRKNS